MQKLKYILTITSTSFTLVVLLNCLLVSKDYHQNILSALLIFEIFITCLLIGIATVYIESIQFVSEHIMISSYATMMLIAFSMELIFQRHFRYIDFIIEFIFLTIIFIGVWLVLQCVHGYEANQINQQIKKRRKRKLK